MGIEKTNLNNVKIKYVLKKIYNINVLNITKIERGTSNIFKIETQDNKYILKEFIIERKKETIIKEVNIINYLQDKNINVPKYVKTINGDFYTENEGRIMIVQEFIEGYTIDNNTGDYNQTMQCANILGKLTKELANYQQLEEKNSMEEYFSKARVHTGIRKMEQLKSELKNDNKYKDEIKKDLEYKIKISKEIENNFDFDVIKKLTILNSHGDFCSQQLIYSNKKEPTIIDFEKARKLPIVWEVIRSYTYIDKKVKNGNINVDILVDYFKEFNKYIKLNQYDLKYASYLYLLQLVSSTYGYKEYNEDYSQSELLDFAVYRTNLCKSLYEKADEISLKLEKIYDM